MVGVSWRDATAYAEWITSKTGVPHRLPTDEEWVFAAGDKASDDALPLVDPIDPAQAWIARYEAEANRARPVALDPQPVGAFGRNENGLSDIGGNVWEWTNTCFLRMTIEPNNVARVTNTNCGVRVVQGAHRTYMTDFIRDPRTGGCAAGVRPPISASVWWSMIETGRRCEERSSPPSQARTAIAGSCCAGVRKNTVTRIFALR